MKAPRSAPGSLLAWCVAGLMVMCGVAAAWAADVDPAHVGFKDLEAHTRVSWHDSEEMVLGGVPVLFRRFSSSESAVGTAQAFARGSGMFDQVLAFRGRLVLSGARGGWHWVAEISDGAHGARGLVSAMSLNATRDSIKPDARVVPDWLPAGARMRFDQALGPKGVRLRQGIYHLAQSPSEARKIVRARLAGLGWSQVPGSPGITPVGMETWVRRRSRLLLAFVPDAPGSALFVQLRE